MHSTYISHDLKNSLQLSTQLPKFFAMGAGASLEHIKDASVEDLQLVLQDLPSDQVTQLKSAVALLAGGASSEEIPAAWGWPKEPLDPEALRLHVLEVTKPTQQEAWDDALAARSIDGKKEDFVEEKAFANLLLNKEGTGEQKKDRGIDHHAYEKGKWYRFLNFKGDCYAAYPAIQEDNFFCFCVHGVAQAIDDPRLSVPVEFNEHTMKLAKKSATSCCHDKRLSCCEFGILVLTLKVSQNETSRFLELFLGPVTIFC